MATYDNVKKIKIGDNVFNLYSSGGTVTSVDITNNGGISVSGSPITTSGNISVGLLAATDSVLGGIKTGFSTSEVNRNYAVALEANSNKAYVNVPWTDTQVSSAANHYAPQTATGSDKTASASGATATWGIDVVKGITIKTDGKGHITDLSVTSGKIPANPNTDIKVQQNHSTANTNYPILISGTSSSTSARTGTVLFNQNAYINPSKSAIYAKMVKADEGVFNKLIATDANFTNATVVGLLDIKGELHTNSWTNSSIANVGGSFYISPTVMTEYEEASNSQMSVTINGDANLRTMVVSGGDFATDTVKIYNNRQTSSVPWSIGSRVMITGSLRATVNGVITDYPLGTCIGDIGTPLSTDGFSVSGIKSAALENILSATNTTTFSSKKIQISMFEIGPNNSLKPIGMMMQSYGVDKSTYMDIYGGVNIRSSSSTSVIPNVRIGYLGDLPSFPAGGVSHQPVGWGIYTDNGYFKGVIVADSGAIGGWNLNTNALTGNRTQQSQSGSGSVVIPNFIVLSDGNSGISKEIMGQTRADWSFAIGTSIGISADGLLYATSAYLDNGSLGFLKFSTDNLSYPNVLKITSALFAYTTPITKDGSTIFTPAYRIALSTVKTQSGASEVKINDALEYSNNYYPVGYVDNSYVYTTNINNNRLIISKESISLGRKGTTDSAIQLMTNGDILIGSTVSGDYLTYVNNTSTITSKITNLNVSAGTISQLSATQIDTNTISINGVPFSTTLENISNHFTSIETNLDILNSNLTNNYYTKLEINDKDTALRTEISNSKQSIIEEYLMFLSFNTDSSLTANQMNLGKDIAHPIMEIRNAASEASSTSFGISKQLFFENDDNGKKWASRLGTVISGKPNLNDVWIGG